MLLLCPQSRSLLLWRETVKMNVFFVFFSFLCSHNQDWVQWVMCLISVLHSMMLPLCLQSCSLLLWIERKRVICRLMSFMCLLSFVFTTQIEFRECCVWFQWFTQWRCSRVSNIVFCWREDKWRVNRWCVSLCVFSLLYLPPRSSSVSVVFDFNTSFNDVAPWSPIVLSVDEKEKEKEEWIVDECFMRLLCIYYSDWEQWVLCLISIIHSMMLLLCLQHSSL